MSTAAIQTDPQFDFDFIHEAVEQQAAFCPRNIAVSAEPGHELTYEELIQQSGYLARRLHGLGVRPDQVVGVCLERSIELIVALLGILRAGAAYLPLDISYPSAHISTLLENAAVDVLITRLPAGSFTRELVIVSPDSISKPEPAGAAPPPRAEPRTELHPENLAYVIHTSGSTGVPKGVAMTHRGLTRLIKWQIQSGPPGLQTLLFTPVSFDVTFQEIFSTLCTGGTAVMLPEHLRRNPEELLALLGNRKIERLFLPYVALQQLAVASQRTGVIPKSLKHVITAGERLLITEAIANFFQALPECRLDNHYGPTEAHLVTSWTLSDDPAAWSNFPPIGTPVSNVALHILNDELRPVPAGEPGELYVSGDGLARGYLNASDLTAERFVPCAFAATPGARMYRTGDVGRIGVDGVVEFLGRVDNQLKVRGFRVEPAEVEIALMRQAQVRQAVVSSQMIAPQVEALVAFVVAEGALTVSDLSQHLRATLPPYMIPSRFFFLEQIPVTANGKIDLRSLSELVIPAVEAEPARKYSSPEDVIRSIWERVLGHDEFEPDDDFFEVGGDSLLAAWVVAELNQVLEREIELSTFLRDSSLRGLVLTLESLALAPAEKKSATEIVTLRPGPSQRSLYFVHPLGGELLAYRELARVIKAPLRVLGLRWRPENGLRPAGMTVAEMAAAHWSEISSIQPSGPYLLAGWSFGGVLAFEIAQQMIAAGEEVSFLGLFDASPVRDPLSGRVISDTKLYEELTNLLGEIAVRSETGDGARGLNQLISNTGLGALIGGSVPEGVTGDHVRTNLQITRNSIWAAMNYSAQPYRGDIDLFQPEETSPALRELLETELRQLALGNFCTHRVPGDHYSILRPPLVEQLAAALDSKLQTIS